MIASLKSSLANDGSISYYAKKLKSNDYVIKKNNELSAALNTSLGMSHLNDQSNTDDKIDAQYFRDLVKKLKNKFDSPDTDQATKIQILTLLPQEWSAAAIAKTMNTTQYIARKSKKLLAEKGVLSLPDKKQGKYLTFSCHALCFIQSLLLHI